MNKEIKLFLSSTFDEKMREEERDYFRNEINAELNQVVGQIGTNLFLHDYELGISKDEVFSNVLDICFQKIDESDYFVGLIGDNYGTHINDKLNEEAKLYEGKFDELKGKISAIELESIIEKLKETYTGKFKELLDEGIRENRSVLELEFIKALKNKKQKKLFFIKNNIPNNNINVQNLITRIQTSTKQKTSLKVFTKLFNITDATSNIKVLYYNEYNEILSELRQYFENEIKNEINKFSIEQRNRNLIYANKTRYYVENTSIQTTINELNDYIKNDSQKVFVLSGKAGSGKRTTLSQWIQNQEDKNISDSKTKIISAFAGVDGNTISDILLKIYSQVPTFNKSSDKQEEQEEKSLLDRFAQFTFEISKQFSKALIVIDGINQLTFTSEWKNKYWWLSKVLENNVKIIVSSIEDNVEDIHFERAHTIHPQNLSKLIVENYLQKEGKCQIYGNFQGKLFFEKRLPIFARLLCTEICVTAKYDNIDVILDKYNRIFSSDEESDMLDLYQGFLQRLAKRQSLSDNALQELCRYLYYSENGLHKDTLQLLFKNGNAQVNSFYSLLYFELIRNIDDKIAFSTTYFRRAVEKLYIVNNNEEKKYRTAIINVLENSPRAKEKEVLAERAYQIYEIKDKQKMYDLLSDIDNAEKLYRLNYVRFFMYLNNFFNGREEEKNNMFNKYENTLLTPEHIYFLASYYNDIYNFEKALEYYNKDLAISEKVLGKEHPDVAVTYNKIALVYYYKGDYDCALEYLWKALGIREKVLGKEHPNTATTYNNMATVYQAQGNYESALEYFEKTLNIRENVLGNNHPNTATTYNNIALVYHALGNYECALEYFGKALGIVEKVLGKEHPNTAYTYGNIAGVYVDMSDFDFALKYYEKALVINEKILGKEHSDTATTYNGIAKVYNDKGDFDNALEYYEKALVIDEKILGKEHPKTASIYNNIALTYYALGNYDRALEYYRKALDIREKVLGKEHTATATTYNNIALVYYALGNYDNALDYYEKALAIEEKVLGKEHQSISDSCTGIAAVYYARGDFDRALKYYEKALSIREKVLGECHPKTANTYNNIAAIYYAQGNYVYALEYYLKALNIQEKVLGKEHFEIATTYNNIAAVYYTQGNLDRALEHYEKALIIREKILGKEHPDIATVFNNMAAVFHAQGDSYRALDYYGKALNISKKVWGKEHPSIASTYNNMALVYDNSGNYDKALEWYIKSLSVLIVVLGVEHPTTKTVLGNIQRAYEKSRKPEHFEEWLRKRLRACLNFTKTFYYGSFFVHFQSLFI